MEDSYLGGLGACCGDVPDDIVVVGIAVVVGDVLVEIEIDVEFDFFACRGLNSIRRGSIKMDSQVVRLTKHVMVMNNLDLKV